jgi:hypothetical protein
MNFVVSDVAVNSPGGNENFVRLNVAILDLNLKRYLA